MVIPEQRIMRLFSTAFLLVCMHVCGAQSLMVEVQGGASFPSLGTTLVAAGDIDGDGFEDFATAGAVPSITGAPATHSARVRVFSGVDAGLIYEEDVTIFASPALQVSLNRVGDLSGDGLPDLALGLVDSSALGILPGQVRILDAASGSLLLFLQGFQTGDSFGTAVIDIGDLTGDGVPDLAIGAPALSVQTTAPATIHLVSGADGSVFQLLGGPYPNSGIGRELVFLGDAMPASPGPELVTNFALVGGAQVISLGGVYPWAPFQTCPVTGLIGPSGQIHLAGLGDLDGDGGTDFAVLLAPLLAPSTGAAVTVLPGAGGPCLHGFFLPITSSCATLDAVGVPDVDGDGGEDLALVSLAAGLAVEVFSPLTAASIASIPLGSEPCPVIVEGISDLNGDGLGDLLVGFPASGVIQVWSSAPAPAVAEILGSGFSWSGPVPQLGSNAPVLGHVLGIQLLGAQPLAQGLFVLAPGPGNPVPVLPGFVIHPDLTDTAAWSILPFQATAAGDWSLQVPLPLDLGLSGIQVVSQAYFPSPLGFSGASISNGLRLTLGF